MLAMQRRHASSQRLTLRFRHAERLLQDLDRLSERATGALVFGDSQQHQGTVLLERGRLCWAMARRMGKRLTDLLARQSDPPVSEAVLEEVYQRCRRERAPLGEELVRSGHVTSEGLHRALRQHTAEALAVLAETPGLPMHWIDRSAQTYNPRFTFSPAELLVELGALTQRSLSVKAQEELAAALVGGGQGVAFLRATGAPQPFACFGLEDLTVEGVLGLGRWALGSADVAGALSERRDVVCALDEAGAGLLTWSTDGVLYAAVCADPSTFACAVSLRLRARGAPTTRR